MTTFSMNNISHYMNSIFSVAEIKNRKILEDLQLKKQLIVQKGVSISIDVFPRGCC